MLFTSPTGSFHTVHNKSFSDDEITVVASNTRRQRTPMTKAYTTGNIMRPLDVENTRPSNGSCLGGKRMRLPHSLSMSSSRMGSSPTRFQLQNKMHQSGVQARRQHHRQQQQHREEQDQQRHRQFQQRQLHELEIPETYNPQVAEKLSIKLPAYGLLRQEPETLAPPSPLRSLTKTMCPNQQTHSHEQQQQVQQQRLFRAKTWKKCSAAAEEFYNGNVKAINENSSPEKKGNWRCLLSRRSRTLAQI